jgi:hypothetical protein
MGFWGWLKAKFRRRPPPPETPPELYRLAHDYEIFPKLVPLKGGSWAVTAPPYRPAIASTPEKAIQQFRRQNPRRRPSP